MAARKGATAVATLTSGVNASNRAPGSTLPVSASAKRRVKISRVSYRGLVPAEAMRFASAWGIIRCRGAMDFVEQVKGSVDIVSVIGDRVRLKKSGPYRF